MLRLSRIMMVVKKVFAASAKLIKVLARYLSTILSKSRNPKKGGVRSVISGSWN